MIDAKTLKKLAATCRKSGIKHYKCAEFEFTLTDDMPEPHAKQMRQNLSSPSSSGVDEVQSETLTDDALLFWSSVGSNEGMSA